MISSSSSTTTTIAVQSGVVGKQAVVIGDATITGTTSCIAGPSLAAVLCLVVAEDGMINLDIGIATNTAATAS